MLSDLTISVVSHGHGRLLDMLLEDLRSAGIADVSRIVVTINTQDASFPFEKWRHSRIDWIINTEPKGFGANHNAALRSAQTSWVLVLNPDIRLESHTLEALLEVASRVPEVGLVAPTVMSGTGQIEDSVRSNLSLLSILSRGFQRIRLSGLPARTTCNDSPAWFAGMFLLMPRKIFEDVGGFDERYFLYCEDYDLCARISLSGRRLIWDEASTVVHNAQRSSHRSLKYFSVHLRSLLKVWCSAVFWKYTISLWTKTVPGVTRAKSVDL